MSLLNYLQFQEIEPSDDIPYEHRLLGDDISLNEQVDEDSLEVFWDRVVDDIHQDPSWQAFSD